MVAAGERRDHAHSPEQSGGQALGSCPGALHGGGICVTWTLGTNLLSLLAFDDFSLLDLIFPDGFAGIFSLSIKSTAKGIFEPTWENIRCFQESAGALPSTQSQVPSGAHPSSMGSRLEEAMRHPLLPQVGQRGPWESRVAGPGMPGGPGSGSLPEVRSRV